MLVKLRAISPNTIAERITAPLLKVMVNHFLSALLLNIILKANNDSKIEKIISVQKPTNETSVNKTIER